MLSKLALDQTNNLLTRHSCSFHARVIITLAGLFRNLSKHGQVLELFSIIEKSSKSLDHALKGFEIALY